MSKILNTRIQQKYDSESNWSTVESTFVPLDGEVVVYGSNDLTSPKLKIGDGTTTLEELPFLYAESSAPELTPIPYPTVSGTYIYNGAAQTVKFNDYDTNKLYVYGTTTQTNAGTYEMVFEPKSGYCWEDGSATLYTVNWTINKGTPTLTLSSTSMTLTDVNESFGSTVTTNSTGTISVVSSNTSIAEAYVSYGTVYVYSPNKKNGTATITVTVGATSNYNSASSTISVNTDFIEVDPTLENNTWEVISAVSATGMASSYWEVGQRKLLYEYDSDYAFILDFRNSQIIFGWASDYDNCGQHHVIESVYFQEVIGGTDRPSWSASTLRNYLNNTRLTYLPQDLRSVIKISEVHSTEAHQYGQNSYTTQDLLYIPSEVEIYGAAAQYANNYDKQYQTQFTYYANGNSKMFYALLDTYPVWCFTRCVIYGYYDDPNGYYGGYGTLHVYSSGDSIFTGTTANREEVWEVGGGADYIAPTAGVLPVFAI